ncbi:MAG TPA: Rrf2 family transcriptional regulator [Acidimicrobiia bacterium]|nr:Rrf2 family transcriptional regulator [Acidimicrobiia bacterium]
MRLELDQRTELAAQALIVLDVNDPGYQTGTGIADRLSISLDYLTKILAPLIREGWIASAPGRGGGYRLTKSLDGLCVLDLIEAVEGRVDRNQCMHGDSRNPPTELCRLHDPWVRARESLLRELEETPLAIARLSSPTKGE